MRKPRIETRSLRVWLEVYDVVSEKNELRESIESLNFLCRLKAETLESDTDDEYVAAGEESVTKKKWRIRYNKKLTSDHVIRFEGEDFEIKSVSNTADANVELIITAVTREASRV